MLTYGKTASIELDGVYETVFNWGLGWDMLSEESGAGTLQRTYVGRHGHVDGTDPSTGDYAHYLHDHLGSVRAVYDQAKALLATSAYTPYGDRYAAQADETTPLGYTGHYWEGVSGLYYAPYRHYSPSQARWMSRDPLGMVDGPNVYAYVVGNPVMRLDPEGAFIGTVLKEVVKKILDAALIGCKYFSDSECTKARCQAVKSCVGAFVGMITTVAGFGTCIVACASTGPLAPACILGCAVLTIADAALTADDFVSCKQDMENARCECA